MEFAEYDRFDALGLAKLVEKGDVTPLELVDTAIARIEELNPRLNAVIFTDFEGARERAREKLPDGPFKGVPFLLKDILGDLEGWPTRNGSRLSPPLPMPAQLNATSSLPNRSTALSTIARTCASLRVSARNGTTVWPKSSGPVASRPGSRSATRTRAPPS